MGDHAQVAMHRLGGMDEVGGGAGAGHGRRDLARDVARLADAGNDDPAGAGQDQRDRALEGAVDALGQCSYGRCFNAQDSAGQVDGACRG